jgi:hypothetical protein
MHYRANDTFNVVVCTFLFLALLVGGPAICAWIEAVR